MVLHKAFIDKSSSSPHSLKSGFSLIELLVVIGIIGMLMSLSLFMDLNGYRGDAFRAEVSTLGIALQTARANALNNINEEKHGVAINPPGYKGYVIFEGESYSTRIVSHDHPIAMSYKVNISPSSPSEIVFDQLSGNGSVNADIILLDPERSTISTVISINHEGKISW